MSTTPIPGILVIGIGNEFRSDDAAGLVALRKLQEKAPGKVRMLEHSGEGASLLESWRGAEAVVLIDAVASGAAPGTVHRLDAAHEILPAGLFRHSTHAFGIAEAIEMGRALERLPKSLIVYGIEARKFEAGTALSPEVLEAAEKVVERVLKEVNSPSSPR